MSGRNPDANRSTSLYRGRSRCPKTNPVGDHPPEVCASRTSDFWETVKANDRIEVVRLAHGQAVMVQVFTE
jgi:hypothetical protein